MQVSCDVRIFDVLTKQHEIIKISAYVTHFNTPQLGLVIGKDTIIQHQLLQRMVPCILGTPNPSLSTSVTSTLSEEVTSASVQHADALTAHQSESVAGAILPNGQPLQPDGGPVPNGTIFSKAELLTPSPDTEEESTENLFPDEPFDIKEDPSTDIMSILRSNTHGSDIFKSQAEQLFSKWRSIFSTTVRDLPARVKPMLFEVDRNKWERPANRTPLRAYSHEQSAEAKKQIDLLCERNVLERTQALHHSHMLFVKKKDKSWRFCLDFRALNDASSSLGYPLPNIQRMLRRIGQKRPAHFAVIDFTSGYHQMPLDESIRKFTAFNTEWGKYQWNRVPMGLKGATSYFQEVMEEVLHGLVGEICEIYIDDIIVFAKTEEELLRHLDLILERIKEVGLVINPRKCAVGKTRIEYVGFAIDKDGIHITETKKDVVQKIARPVTLHDLRSFLGFTNYFRQMIRRYADIAAPLERLKASATGRHQRLEWTDESIAAFNTLKAAVDECPHLSFMAETAPVVLETDASDYGIGACLYQVIDNKPQPIEFFSKALHGAQLRWSTTEKEAYAIFASLKKWEHLLISGPRFTIRTDHQALVYLNSKDCSHKVHRWKLAIQPYDFQIEHIKGENNVVADALSRLIETPTPQAEEQFFAAFISNEGTTSVDDNFDLGGPSRIDDIPPDKVAIIQRYHNATVGHHGVQRTLRLMDAPDNTGMIPASNSWRHRKRHVAAFIRRCDCCQMMSVAKPPDAETEPYTLSTYTAMERLDIDTIGPLPIDEFQSKYILVIVDAFTRYVRLTPTPDATAISAGRALFNFVCEYGLPREIQTDGGKQFSAEVISNLTELIECAHTITSAYSHEENSLVERANKEVGRHLRNIVYDKRVANSWSAHVPTVQRIINAIPHHSTRLAPAQLMMGSRIDLTRGLILPWPERTEAHQSIDEWYQDTSDEILWLSQQARASLSELDKAHLAERIAKRKSNPKLTDPIDPAIDKRTDQERAEQYAQFQIGTYVLIEYPDGPPNKLSPAKDGPYKIISRDRDIFVLTHASENVLRTAHIQRLTPFKHSDEHSALVAGAKAKQMSIVKRIIDHKPKSANKQRPFDPEVPKDRLKFIVEWEGEKNITVETWNELKHNAALHAYLTANNAAHYIPRGDADKYKKK
jgi:hypothetical protein